MDEFLIKLGKRIKNLRTSKKLTVEALCYSNGLEPSTVLRIEKRAKSIKSEEEASQYMQNLLLIISKI